LLGVIQFAGTAGVLVKDVVDVLESLLKHAVVAPKRLTAFVSGTEAYALVGVHTLGAQEIAILWVKGGTAGPGCV
jgi:hypothetical protein